MQGGIDAGGNTDQELDRECRQRQRQRHRDPLRHQFNRGAAIAHRAAEFALSDRPEIVEILQPERIIEAPGRPEGGDRLRRRLGAQNDLRRIARQAQDDEGEGHH